MTDECPTGHEGHLDEFMKLLPRFIDLFATFHGPAETVTEMKDLIQTYEVRLDIKFPGWRDLP